MTFDQLVRKLEENPIFLSTGRKPQRPVRHQLAAFLFRFGKRGADVMATAKELAIGAGTVILYCRRVTRALRELGIEVVSWGDADRQKQTADWIEEHYGIPDCTGTVDGSLIRLAEMPHKFGIVYICRKKYPAVSVVPYYPGILAHVNISSTCRLSRITRSGSSTLRWAGLARCPT